MSSFIILRREAGGFSTRGPIAPAMTLKDARAETIRLKKIYPHQDFVIMGEVGAVSRSERVSVKIAAPELPAPKPRKPRKQIVLEEPAVLPDNTNIVLLRKEESA
jgi:hypothetical protein